MTDTTTLKETYGRAITTKKLAFFLDVDYPEDCKRYRFQYDFLFGLKKNFSEFNDNWMNHMTSFITNFIIGASTIFCLTGVYFIYLMGRD